MLVRQDLCLRFSKNARFAPWEARVFFCSLFHLCRRYNSTSRPLWRSSPPSTFNLGPLKKLSKVRLTTSAELDSFPEIQKRRKSRRRFSADNTRGRSEEIKDIMKALKSFGNKEDRAAFFSRLHPREKVDLLRMIHRKSKERKRHFWGLPKYYSRCFGRSFFFREEDLQETSTLGRGPGGQATNRRKQTVLLVHMPTQLSVKVSRFPSLRLNKRAAREILNLRLEEHLIGSKSLLGRAKLVAARRAKQGAREREERMWRKAVKAWKESHSTNYYGFLKGDEPLPSYVITMARLESILTRSAVPIEPRTKGSSLHSLYSSCRSRSFFITDVLNMNSSLLWRAVFQSCAAANPSIHLLEGSFRVLVPTKGFLRRHPTTFATHTTKNDKSGNAMTRKECASSAGALETDDPSFCASMVHPPQTSATPTVHVGVCHKKDYHVPALLHFLFPVFEENSSVIEGSAEKEQENQRSNAKHQGVVERCRNNPVVLSRVRALLTVFCELFGLRLDEAHTSFSSESSGFLRNEVKKGAQSLFSEGRALVLVKDSGNWEEFRSRLFTANGELTHVSCIIWFHILESVRDMGFEAEQNAVNKFFRQHTRRIVKRDSAK